MSILQGRLLLFVPHECLQGRQAHMFIRFVRPAGVPEGMDTHLFANTRLFDILGNRIFDR